ncbi:hypothetical protein FB567DRAFT_529428, partial [Paraphoma chrysanthemicola]
MRIWTTTVCASLISGHTNTTSYLPSSVCLTIPTCILPLPGELYTPRPCTSIIHPFWTKLMRILHHSVDRRPGPFCSVFFPYIPLCSYFPSTTRALSFSPSVRVGCFAYIIRDQSTEFKLILSHVMFLLPCGISKSSQRGRRGALKGACMLACKRWFG